MANEMRVQVREYTGDDLPEMLEIWNAVVADGNVFPHEELLDSVSGSEFFASQSRSAVAYNFATNEVLGLYILHPNNVGRCGHICNASYAVKRGLRGQRIGERLVRESVDEARALGFRVLQFNAVVASNAAALHLYEKLGFVRLGTIPGGFRMNDGSYEDIIPHYCVL